MRRATDRRGTSCELGVGEVLELGVCRLSLDGEGVLTAVVGEVSVVVRVAGDECAVAVAGRSVVVIGERDACVHTLRAAGGRMCWHASGPVERLDLEGGYDPGGMDRVDLTPLAEDDVLVRTLIGIARVRAGVVLWEHLHHDGWASLKVTGRRLRCTTGNARRDLDLDTGAVLRTRSL